jgi:hypothetical protein
MKKQNKYRLADRWLYQLVFSTPSLQKALCSIENDLFNDTLDSIKLNHETFITGLPRAGTTLILNLLYQTGEFATYTYRQMPFILTPLLWRNFSRPFQKNSVSHERAHRDGVAVSFDSPEAFEESIWLAYLGHKIVRPKFLRTLSVEDYTDDFAGIIRNAAKKCIVIKGHNGIAANNLRYIAKNNADISRLSLLQKIFPTAKILVVFRHPLAQVSSLIKQHQRFCEKHRQDKFAKKYMRWLGHFEFGGTFKPINFSNWLDEARDLSAANVDFWIKYWHAAYTYVLEHKNKNISFVSFERLLHNSRIVLQNVAEYLDLQNNRRLITAAEILRPPPLMPLVPLLAIRIF